MERLEKLSSVKRDAPIAEQFKVPELRIRPENMHWLPVTLQLRPNGLKAEKTNTSDDSDIYQVNTIGKLTANKESIVIDFIQKIHTSEEFNHPGISNTKINAERFLKYKIARKTVKKTLKDWEVCKRCKNKK
jgi:hypothetical protein